MFPSNSFNQEPYNSDKIEKSYRGKLGAKWWISEKIEVNGENTHPIYVFLRQNSELQQKSKNEKSKALSLGQIPWNYAKFLVDGQGKVVAYYPPTTAPSKLIPDIARYCQ